MLWTSTFTLVAKLLSDCILYNKTIQKNMREAKNSGYPLPKNVKNIKFLSERWFG